ncbi:hypothetical protein L7F22_058704 [Adiantum nelumboides]|nr:hypothetical protein [Adiantum nelumboides]
MADRPAGRVHKRIISDQQKRRDISLQRQSQSRRDLQQHARQLVSLAVPLSSSSLLEAHNAARVYQNEETSTKEHSEPGQFEEFPANAYYNQLDTEEENDLGMLQATKLRGSRAREWFKQQFMQPEWMVDVPSRLPDDWYGNSVKHFVFQSSLCLQILPI